jgi:Ca2+-binding RTX toxin-like protein
MVLVQVIDIATGQVVAEYPIPPTDEFFTITQGATGVGSISGTGTELGPYVVNMAGGVGTAFVTGNFDQLDFTADVDAGSSYRLVSASGKDLTEGMDTQTTFTAVGTDADGDSVSTAFDVTFDSGVELTGGAGDDVMVGNGGSQALIGNLGDDLIDGGLGIDILWGDAIDGLGGGADTLRWGFVDEIDSDLDGLVDSVDTVKDYSGAGDGDTLDVSELLSELGVTDLAGLPAVFQTSQNGDNAELQLDLGSGFQTFAIIGSTLVADLIINDGGLV